VRRALGGRLGLLLTAAGVLTVGVCLAVLMGWSPGLPHQWQWLSRHPHGGRLWVPLLWLLAATGTGRLLWGLRREGRLRPWLVVIALWLAAWTWCLALMATQAHWWLRGAGIISSPIATTYFNEATRTADLNAYLADYPRLMPTLTQHASTHPPGPVVLFWVLDRLVQGSPGLQSTLGVALRAAEGVDADGLAGVLNASLAYQAGFSPLAPADALAALLAVLALPALGALAAPLLYLAGRLLGGERPALAAGLLAVFVPSWALFAPGLDQVLTALAAAFTLALAGAAGGSLLAGMGAGLLLAVGLWLSPGAGALGAWGVLWLAFSRGKRVWRPGAAATVAFALAMLGISLTAGVGYFQVLQAGLQAHHAITTETVNRSYLAWLAGNPLDFALFCGPAVALLAMVAFIRPGSGGRPAWLWAWLAVMTALVLSGVVRGEVGRIWGLLMIPAVLAAAGVLVRREPRAASLAVLLTAGLLALQCVMFRLGLVLISPW